MRGWGLVFGFLLVVMVAAAASDSRAETPRSATSDRAPHSAAENRPRTAEAASPPASAAAPSAANRREVRAIDRVIVSEPLPEIPQSVRLDIATAPAAFAWTPIVTHANGRNETSAMIGASGAPSLTLYLWLMMTGLIAFAGWYGWSRQTAITSRIRTGISKAPWAADVARAFDTIGARFRQASSFAPGAGDAASYSTDVLEKRLSKVADAVADVPRSVPLREVLEDELRRVRQRLAAASAVTEQPGAGEPIDGATPRGRLSGPAFRVLLRDLERIERIAVSAQRSITAGDGAQPLAMPTSAREAYEVLGINGNVTDATLKKVVDALRMSWHPDLANGADDRALREERIKQINVATELIAAERRAA